MSVNVTHTDQNSDIAIPHINDVGDDLWSINENNQYLSTTGAAIIAVHVHSAKRALMVPPHLKYSFVTAENNCL